MFLTHRFAAPEVNSALELFLRMIGDFFGERLVSVVLYGSIVFDDLAPGYGDLDFLAVVEDDLSAQDCQQLVELRRPLRSGDYGVLCQMLEGAFLPRRLLNPEAKGSALWWGGTGERMWEASQLGWLVLRVIRERGIVIWGEDIRPDIPPAPRYALLDEIWKGCENAAKHDVGSGPHSVDGLLTAARMLFWLREGKLSSKSEAAHWGHIHARGCWRQYLIPAKKIRKDPSLAHSSKWKAWLKTIEKPTYQAWEEVRDELLKTGFKPPATSGSMY